jgi:opacity protein-like surface antigen
MKKLCFLAFITIAGLTQIHAQADVNYGVTAGYFSGIASGSIKIAGFSTSLGLDESGFYIGGLADIEVTDSFNVQPELLYVNIGGESMIAVPVMIKYYVAESFNIQAGPQLDFFMNTPKSIKSLGFGLGIGAGYDINEKFTVQAKYTFGLNDRIDGGILDDLISSVASIKLNTFQIGVVYKL